MVRCAHFGSGRGNFDPNNCLLPYHLCVPQVGEDIEIATGFLARFTSRNPDWCINLLIEATSLMSLYTKAKEELDANHTSARSKKAT